MSLQPWILPEARYTEAFPSEFRQKLNTWATHHQLAERIEAFVREFGPRTLPSSHVFAQIPKDGQAFDSLRITFEQYSIGLHNVHFKSHHISAIGEPVSTILVKGVQIPVIDEPHCSSRRPAVVAVATHHFLNEDGFSTRTVTGPRWFDHYHIDGDTIDHLSADPFRTGSYEEASKALELPFTFKTSLFGDEWTLQDPLMPAKDSLVKWNVELNNIGTPKVQLVIGFISSPFEVVGRRNKRSRSLSTSSSSCFSP